MDKQGEDLEERLLEFASRVGKLVDAIPDTRLGRHVALRSLHFTIYNCHFNFFNQRAAVSQHSQQLWNAIHLYSLSIGISSHRLDVQQRRTLSRTIKRATTNKCSPPQVSEVTNYSSSFTIFLACSRCFSVVSFACPIVSFKSPDVCRSKTVSESNIC